MRYLHSAAWQGVLSAGMYSNLWFMYNHAPPEWTKPQPNCTTCGSFSKNVSSEVELYASQLKQLLPGITAPFGIAHPTVHVECNNASHVGPIRARAWSTPNCSCIVLAVVNTDELNATLFTLTIHPTPTARSAVRLTGRPGTVPVSSGGTVLDNLDAGMVTTYRIGESRCVSLVAKTDDEVTQIQLTHLARAGSQSDCIGHDGSRCREFHFPDALYWVGDSLVLQVATDPDECNATGGNCKSPSPVTRLLHAAHTNTHWRVRAPCCCVCDFCRSYQHGLWTQLAAAAFVVAIFS